VTEALRETRQTYDAITATYVRREVKVTGRQQIPLLLADGSVDRPVEEVAYAIGRYLELAAPKPGPGPVAEAGLDG
jgi:hypothetical protein